MNFLCWLLALSVTFFLLWETILFHQKMVCRQEAWLKGTELLTRATLESSGDHDFHYLFGCGIKVIRTRNKVFWNTHLLDVPLRGKL